MPPAPSARDPRQGPYPRTRRFSTSSDPETAIVKLYGGEWHPSELPPASVHPRQRRCSAEGLEPGEGREGEGGPRRSQGLRRRACVRHLRQRTLAPTILDILRFLIKRGRMTVSLVASSGESVVQASVSTPKAKMREQTSKLRISRIDKFQTVCLLHVLQAIVQSRLPNTLFAALFKSSHGAEQPAVEDVEDEGFADDDVPEQTGELE